MAVNDQYLIPGLFPFSRLCGNPEQNIAPGPNNLYKLTWFQWMNQHWQQNYRPMARGKTLFFFLLKGTILWTHHNFDGIVVDGYCKYCKYKKNVQKNNFLTNLFSFIPTQIHRKFSVLSVYLSYEIDNYEE